MRAAVAGGRVLAVGFAVALPAMLALPNAVGAQTPEWLAIGVSAAHTEVSMNGLGQGREALAGTLFGIEGRGSLWRLDTRGEYRQGRLDVDGTGTTARVVSVRGTFGVRVLPWIGIAGGPRFTRIGSPAGNRDVLRWRVEMVGTAPLVSGYVDGFASVAGSVAGTDVDGFSPMQGGGGELGLLFAPPGRPLWASLGFRMDRESLPDGAFQIVETAYLSVGLSAPRLGWGTGR